MKVRTDKNATVSLEEVPPQVRSEARPTSRTAELPDAWARFSERYGKADQRARHALLAELPALIGSTRLERNTAHLAVHAVMMGLAAGTWGRHGAPTITTDRVLSSIAAVDALLAKHAGEALDPAFLASYERFSRLAERALDHCGPLGLWGPTSIYGPIDDHPSNPSSLYSSFQHLNVLDPAALLTSRMRPTSPDDASLVKRTGEHHFELLPGNLLAFVGPPSALYWMLGAAGHLGPSDLSRTVEGGGWTDQFGEVVTRTTTKEGGAQLFEVYGEEHATRDPSPDAFFAVEGSAPAKDVDAYRFDSRQEQWITIGCSQVTPGRRFSIELFQVAEDGARTRIDGSAGEKGPAGIHTKVPPGAYEVVVSQLAPNEAKPELSEHPVGKRLGPSLMRQREAWGEAFPEAVNRASEADPDRYRLFVSGTGPVDDAAFGPPARAAMTQALASSALQEGFLEQCIIAMEATLAGLDLFTPMRFLIPPDDVSNPREAADPTVERFMRAASRLGALFYRTPGLSEWLRIWAPAWAEPIRQMNRTLEENGLQPIPLPKP